MSPLAVMLARLLLVIVAVLSLACDLRGLDPPARDRRSAATSTAAAAQDAPDRDAPRFAPGQLEQHFRKHGTEMGFATQDEYLRAAQALVRGGAGVETW